VWRHILKACWCTEDSRWISSWTNVTQTPPMGARANKCRSITDVETSVLSLSHPHWRHNCPKVIQGTVNSCSIVTVSGTYLWGGICKTFYDNLKITLELRVRKLQFANLKCTGHFCYNAHLPVSWSREIRRKFCEHRPRSFYEELTAGVGCPKWLT